MLLCCFFPFCFVLLIFHQFYEKWSVNRTFPNQKKHNTTHSRMKIGADWNKPKVKRRQSFKRTQFCSTSSIVAIFGFRNALFFLLFTLTLSIFLFISVSFQNSTVSTLYVYSLSHEFHECLRVCVYVIFFLCFLLKIRSLFRTRLRLHRYDSQAMFLWFCCCNVLVCALFACVHLRTLFACSKYDPDAILLHAINICKHIDSAIGACNKNKFLSSKRALFRVVIFLRSFSLLLARSTSMANFLCFTSTSNIDLVRCRMEKWMLWHKNKISNESEWEVNKRRNLRRARESGGGSLNRWWNWTYACDYCVIM